MRLDSIEPAVEDAKVDLPRARLMSSVTAELTMLLGGASTPRHPTAIDIDEATKTADNVLPTLIESSLLKKEGSSALELGRATN
jgi:hypothetical protein